MKTKHSKIVFIGAGNVATALAHALGRKRQIIQIYSKSLSSAKKLGNTMGCSYTDSLKKLTTEADEYIIAVKDDAVERVASELRLKNKLVVHTSGSVDVDALKQTSLNYGVLYPLQTFSRNSKLQRNIPFCIEGSNTNAYKQIEALVKILGGKANRISSAQRAILHLAAVFANNFTNYIYSVAYDILKKEKIPFGVLLPLIHETINKLDGHDPVKNQTGPAIRNDRTTLKKHEKMLKNNPQFLLLYKQLTRSIQLSAHAKKL